MFFFSSRRRHTISLRDWSSDVCSSDLSNGTYPAWQSAANLVNDVTWLLGGNSGIDSNNNFLGTTDGNALVFRTRSEERRVGKECRAVWLARQLKKRVDLARPHAERPAW